MRRRLWVLWFVFTFVWTMGLVSPPGLLPQFGPPTEEVLSRRFLAAKVVHVAGYLAWTMLTGWLRSPLTYRIPLLIFLLAHAPLTEAVQLHVGRTGSVRDVLFDHVGIALGVALTWKWWVEEPGR